MPRISDILTNYHPRNHVAHKIPTLNDHDTNCFENILRKRETLCNLTISLSPPPPKKKKKKCCVSQKRQKSSVKLHCICNLQNVLDWVKYIFFLFGKGLPLQPFSTQ